jgi:hypothetical protein
MTAQYVNNQAPESMEESSQMIDTLLQRSPSDNSSTLDSASAALPDPDSSGAGKQPQPFSKGVLRTTLQPNYPKLRLCDPDLSGEAASTLQPFNL